MASKGSANERSNPTGSESAAGRLTVRFPSGQIPLLRPLQSASRSPNPYATYDGLELFEFQISTPFVPEMC